MKYYRCYLLNEQGRFKAVKELQAMSDADALAVARVAYETSGYSGFELWEDGRMLYSSQPRTEPDAAPPGERKRA